MNWKKRTICKDNQKKEIKVLIADDGELKLLCAEICEKRFGEFHSTAKALAGANGDLFVCMIDEQRTSIAIRSDGLAWLPDRSMWKLN